MQKKQADADQIVAEIIKGIEEVKGQEIQILDLLCLNLSAFINQACHDLKTDMQQLDLDRFNQHLYLKNIDALFQDENKNVFEGRIERVDQQGQLHVQTAEGIKQFSVGTIKYLLNLA